MSNQERIRFTHGVVCPVCGGSNDDQRGQGRRCHGFAFGASVYCSREEHAGQCEFYADSKTYAHRAKGPCPCGQEHAPAPLPAPTRRKKRDVDLVYKYEDLAGNVVHETIRYKNPKGFGQRRPDGTGRYIYRGVFDGITPILYKLRQLVEADPLRTVFIVEGEKDVLRLASMGQLATTNPMGAGKWHRVDATPLNGRHCVVLTDNDDPGRNHAYDVGAERHGKAASVKTLALPGLAEHGDVSDWLDAGGTVEQLLDLVAAAPEWAPDPNRPAPTNGKSNGHAALVNGTVDYSVLTAAEMNIIDASAIKMKKIDWLWKYRLAASEMALVAGEGGLGKSQILLWIASAVSMGWEWPDGTGDVAPLGTVIIVTAEDAPETTIVPRLKALGADLSRIKIIRAPKVMIKEQDKVLFVKFQWLVDLPYWHRIFGLYPDTKLMIVDPIVSYLGKGVNDQRNDEVRSVIEPFLDEVIRPTGACFLGNTHLNKSMEAKNIVHRITGSIAYVNLPRNVHVVFRDPDDPEMRVFGQCKSNNAPDNLKAFQFKIAKDVVWNEGSEIETSKPVFEKKMVTLDLKRVTDNEKRGPKPAKSLEDARWLYRQLKGGPVRVRTLVTDAMSAGIIAKPEKEDEKPSISPLYNAKERLQDAYPDWIVDEFKMDGRAVWQLIKNDPETAQSDGAPF